MSDADSTSLTSTTTGPRVNGDGQTRAQSRRSASGLGDRSCVTCHRRKVRCDKKVPCTACARGGRECTYDEAVVRPRRRRRQTTIADVASRVRDLEKSIVGVATPTSQPGSAVRRGSGFRRVPDATHSTPLSSYAPNTNDPESTNEVLVQNGPTSQYVDESIVSRMIEADRDRNSLLSTPQDGPACRLQGSAFSLMGILSHPSAFKDEPDQIVSTIDGMKLWHIFESNIDPMVKVLHIPTAEIQIFTAISQPDSVSKDTMALLYVIYFAAVTSMENEDVVKMLGMEQMAGLAKFRTHFHKALAEADALEHPTLTLLQALAIYLHIVPSWNSSRGSWIFNGMALRMALSIGLHTDGTKLGLSPFDTELRRRVWWHLFARDFRALEDHGISPQLHLPTATTRLPLNIEDSDIWPAMTEPPVERQVFTRMTFQVVNMEVSHAFHQTLYPVGAVFEPGERMALRDEAWARLRAHLDPFFESCQPVVPLQNFCLSIGSAIVHKMDLVTRQRVANLETPNDRDSFATEENLAAACSALEKNIDTWHNVLTRPYRWSQRVHPQYFLVLYVLWHLCVRPDCSQAGRAWGVVDAMFRVEQQRLMHASAGRSLKRVCLERLRKKAEALRSPTMPESERNNDTNVAEAATEPGPADLGFEIGDFPEGGAFDGDFNTDWFDLPNGMTVPNWNTLVSDLSANDYVYANMY